MCTGSTSLIGYDSDSEKNRICTQTETFFGFVI